MTYDIDALRTKLIEISTPKGPHSLKTLAKHSGISRSWLSMFRGGESKAPTFLQIQKLAQFLNRY